MHSLAIIPKNTLVSWLFENVYKILEIAFPVLIFIQPLSLRCDSLWFADSLQVCMYIFLRTLKVFVDEG